MDLSIRKDDYAGALSIRLSESELRRLTQTERDLEARLASARVALEQSSSARQVLLMDAATMLNERAIGAAEDRVRNAEVFVRKLEEGLASARRDHEVAQGRLEVARDQARRLDEAAMVALVICEIVDALKAFERASQRLASALDGSRGKGTYNAPPVAASLRISEIRFATEARAVLNEIEAYRAGLVDGSVKFRDLATDELSRIGKEPARSHQFVAGEPALSVVPSPAPPHSPILSAAERGAA